MASFPVRWASKPAKLNRPISPEEFLAAFRDIICQDGRPLPRSGLLNIGLAISGGVDSMALAALCSKWNNVKWNNVSLDQFEQKLTFSFRAFIVDHGARDGSDSEASQVSQHLESTGIPAHVLKLQWPSGCNPRNLPNFESLARKLRYQALGKACYEHRTEALLTAHHEDDQRETVLMRLLRGARGLNLLGMKAVAEIPECHGIYGVNRSGACLHKLRQHNKDGIGGIQPTIMQMEDGGVRILRPLLNFRKSRLEATSKHYNMHWFEDKTNADPTLTQRNAIRHLYRANLMPESLHRNAFSQLLRRVTDKYLREKISVQFLVEHLFFDQHHPQGEMNWNAGSLRVRFDKLRIPRYGVETMETQHRILANYLRRLIDLVTPKEVVELSTLGTACEAIFPKMFLKHTAAGSSPTNQLKSFTVAGVQFTRLESATSRELARKISPERHEKPVWVLSRQAYSRSEASLPCITFPPTSLWSPWHLFDGRFWIRVLNNTSSTIKLRPFRKEDMAQFSASPKHMRGAGTDSSIKEISPKEFTHLMAKYFPGAIRYTLPAIVRISEDGREQEVVALPTVGVAATTTGVPLDWECRYKYVEGGYSECYSEWEELKIVAQTASEGYYHCGARPPISNG